MSPTAGFAPVSRRRYSPGRRGRYRSLASLLDAQPRGLAKDPRHRLLWDHFMASDRLKKLRISARCYRLLNEAKVPPRNLTDFYRTYRLPEDPFFPLFLAVKSAWYDERARWREEREKAIMAMMRRLPEHRRRALRILAEYERRHHPTGDNPVWENRLFPKTKKRAAEMLRCSEVEWHETWRLHLIRLSWRYRDIPELIDAEGRPTYSSRLLSTLILRCHRVDRKEIAENFRALSKEFHPDLGGSAELFHRIKTARDMLLSKES